MAQFVAFACSFRIAHLLNVNHFASAFTQGLHVQLHIFSYPIVFHFNRKWRVGVVRVIGARFGLVS